MTLRTDSSIMTSEADRGDDSMMDPVLRQYIESAIGEFDTIDSDRKEQLTEISNYIRKQKRNDKIVQLIFICTHNARRSHLAQIWAQTAAAYYGIEKLQTYSGGQEATAFNPGAVAALNRAGFRIEQTTDADNPIYHVRFHEGAKAMTAFSKVYYHAPNPRENFCAVMTCAHANDACPIVMGASARIAIPYGDPKAADNTPEEAAAYDESARQICREMFYAFSLI